MRWSRQAQCMCIQKKYTKGKRDSSLMREPTYSEPATRREHYACSSTPEVENVSHIWHIKTHTYHFHQVRASPIELVNNIWLDMVHTLKGQWDTIIGDSNDKVSQHHRFLTLWKLLHLCPRRMALLFGTFKHQDGLHQTLRNQNSVNCLHQWMDIFSTLKLLKSLSKIIY